MVGATFEGMCYMHGMCFDMLTPILLLVPMGLSRGIGVCVVLVEVCFERLLGGAGGKPIGVLPSSLQ